MNNDQNRTTYTLEALLYELKSLRTNRLVYVLGGGAVATSVWITLSQGIFMYENLIRITMAVLFVYTIVVPSLGSSKLLRIVQNLDASPTPECVSALVSSAIYPLVRGAALQKLIVLCSRNSAPE